MSTCGVYIIFRKCMLGYFCLSRRRVATATEAGSIFVDFVDAFLYILLYFACHGVV